MRRAQSVEAAELLTFKSFSDSTGSLVALNGQKEVPFKIERVCYVQGGGKGALRGNHAHRDCAQVLICLSGRCRVTVDDGRTTKTFLLENANQGVLIPPGLWAREEYLDGASVLLVLADSHYVSEEYIRDYSQFLQYRSKAA
mgnify:FL=1